MVVDCIHRQTGSMPRCPARTPAAPDPQHHSMRLRRVQAGCARPPAAMRREPGGAAAAPAPWRAWQWGLTVTHDARPGDVLAAVPAAAALFAPDRAALAQQLAALRLRQLGLLPAAAAAPAAGRAAGGAPGGAGSPRAPAGGGGGGGGTCSRRGEDAEAAEAGAGARGEGEGATRAAACGDAPDASGHGADAGGALQGAGRAAGGDWAAAALAAHLAATVPPPLALRLAGAGAEVDALREALTGAARAAGWRPYACCSQGRAHARRARRACALKSAQMAGGAPGTPGALNGRSARSDVFPATLVGCDIMRQRLQSPARGISTRTPHGQCRCLPSACAAVCSRPRARCPHRTSPTERPCCAAREPACAAAPARRHARGGRAAGPAGRAAGRVRRGRAAPGGRRRRAAAAPARRAGLGGRVRAARRGGRAARARRRGAAPRGVRAAAGAPPRADVPARLRACMPRRRRSAHAAPGTVHA